MNKKFKKVNGKYFADVTCPDCGESHLVSHKNYYRMKSFRCLRCNQKRIAKISRNPNLKKVTPTGYIKLYRPENPMADKRGEVYEHRLVMSQIIGRPLKSNEHVHHKDGDRSNNLPENLQIFRNQSMHNRLHPPHNKGHCKISKKDIIRVKSLYSTVRYRQIDLAKQFDVSQRLICRIIHRKN